MSWDSKTAQRRRQNSSAAAGRSRGLSLHMRNASKANSGAPIEPPEKIEPKSAHTSDPFLQAFLSPTFDAAEYLNSTLPPLQGAPSATYYHHRSAALPPASSSKPVALADLSTEAQSLLTSLNAHTTRLCGTLTQLTEDILRSGSRLAYEVELLRGETLGLAETLMGEGPLRADLERFLVAAPAAAVSSNSVPPTPAAAETAQELPIAQQQQQQQHKEKVEAEAEEPPYIAHLRTLTLVRARLDAVIKTFGEAMEFVFPPSEISVSSGFLSVSAPDIPGGGTKDQISTEEKGQQVLKKLRDEISGLLKKGGSGSGGDNSDEKIKGVEEATKRVEELKALSVVWKGTAEEKGRQRFVESLARMVEERHREVVREVEQQREQQQQQQLQQAARNSKVEDGASKRDGASSEAATAESRGPLGGYGFMNQWQKIRGGL